MSGWKQKTHTRVIKNKVVIVNEGLLKKSMEKNKPQAKEAGLIEELIGVDVSDFDMATMYAMTTTNSKIINDIKTQWGENKLISKILKERGL